MIIGLGGSATNDGGIGLAIPSGFRFLDRRGRDIPPHGEGLVRLDRIIPPSSIRSIKLIVATDVENPLFGAEGAAFQYAAQKGAKPIQVRRLDRHLRHLAKVAQSSLGFSQHRQLGAGAAGGCGYGLMTFLGAQRQSGFELFRTWSKLDQLIDQHDLVITGEGCLDRTSVQGKGPWAVAQLARQRGKPVWAICGSCRLDLVQTPFTQIGQVISVARDLTHAQRRAATHVRALAKALAAASS
jgi:glycerate kinase